MGASGVSEPQIPGCTYISLERFGCRALGSSLTHVRKTSLQHGVLVHLGERVNPEDILHPQRLSPDVEHPRLHSTPICVEHLPWRQKHGFVQESEKDPKKSGFQVRSRRGRRISRKRRPLMPPSATAAPTTAPTTRRLLRWRPAA